MYDRREHYEDCDTDYFHCGGHRIACNHFFFWSMGALCLVVSSLTVFTVVLGNTLDFCTSHSDCKAGTCEVAYCNIVCQTRPLPNCCSKHSDCPSSACQLGTCGIDNICTFQRQSGTPCDDGSKCTVSDMCDDGVCRGTLTENPCMKCYDDVGFVKDPSKNGVMCSDNNKCTVDDVCVEGVCVGEARVCPNATCKMGVCDPEQGCGYVNTDIVETGSLCLSARCEDGVYTETPKNCFDSNPCTSDACYDLTGVCVNPPIQSEGCLGTCTTSEDCHSIGSNAEYACLDQNCVDITSGEMIIRLSHAEIDFDPCPAEHARMEMRFFMDSEVTNGLFHIPLTESIEGIYPPSLSAYAVDSDYHGSGVRTYFSMATECVDLRVDCYPFINGEYEFVVKRYPCHTISGANCIMQPDSTYVMAPISLISCPYDLNVLLQPVPDLNVDISGFRVNVSLADGDMDTWITRVTLCIPKVTNMVPCIENRAEDCPYLGCYGTDPYYLHDSITFVNNSMYTSAMTTYSTGYKVEMARGYADYDGDKCNSTSVVDWFSFLMVPLMAQYSGKTAVVDVAYEVPLCSGRRLSSSEVRNIGKFEIP